MQKRNIVLSIGLLVSNRKDTIRKCLDSLTPIRKAIPSELIIIDTGCDEDVRSILRGYADTLEKFTWCDDFSAARNETLKYANGEWYLYLDDDEWFVDTKELIEFFQSGEYKQYGYASYIQRNYLDMEASQYTDSWVSRMTKLTPEIHFESKIHEYIAPMNGNVKGLHAVVDHFGYVFETEEALWKHYDRNRVLLEEMIKEEPENLRWYIQLAQEYRTVQEWSKLYELSEHCLKMVGSKNEMYTNIFLGSFYAGKILALKEWGEFEKGLMVCKGALKDNRNTELFRAFAELRMAEFCYWLGCYDEALEHIAGYFKWQAFFQKNEPLLFLQRSAPFAADSFDIVMQKEMYSILMCIGLRRGDISYLQKYFSKLEWEKQHLYVFEDMVQTLIFAMNKQNYVISINDTYLHEQANTRVGADKEVVQDKECALDIVDGELFQNQYGAQGIVRETVLQSGNMVESIDYEIYKMVLHTMYNHSALWKYFCQELCKLEEQGKNVHNIMELIRDVLPEAVASQAEIDNSSNNTPTQNDIAQMNVIQTQEMKQLAEQIKVQLRLLIQNGMYDEARSVLVQIRKMLPEDKELKGMAQLL